MSKAEIAGVSAAAVVGGIITAPFWMPVAAIGVVGVAIGVVGAGVVILGTAAVVGVVALPVAIVGGGVYGAAKGVEKIHGKVHDHQDRKDNGMFKEHSHRTMKDFFKHHKKESSTNSQTTTTEVKWEKESHLSRLKDKSKDWADKAPNLFKPHKHKLYPCCPEENFSAANRM